MNIEFTKPINIDLSLLTEQKQTLAKYYRLFNEQTQEAFDGIENLLNDIIDHFDKVPATEEQLNYFQSLPMVAGYVNALFEAEKDLEKIGLDMEDISLSSWAGIESDCRQFLRMINDLLPPGFVDNSDNLKYIGECFYTARAGHLDAFIDRDFYEDSIQAMLLTARSFGTPEVHSETNPPLLIL